jgi:peptidoglycan DL-endopeptidase CwlO
VVSAAYSTIGTPHVMGGTTPGSGIDCSGMIQYAYAQAGISVPRTTYGMTSLPRVSSPAPGDIVLSNGNSHGGIYVGNGQVISTTYSNGVQVHDLHAGWHNVTSYHRPG